MGSSTFKSDHVRGNQKGGRSAPLGTQSIKKVGSRESLLVASHSGGGHRPPHPHQGRTAHSGTHFGSEQQETAHAEPETQAPPGPHAGYKSQSTASSNSDLKHLVGPAVVYKHVLGHARRVGHITRGPHSASFRQGPIGSQSTHTVEFAPCHTPPSASHSNFVLPDSQIL